VFNFLIEIVVGSRSAAADDSGRGGQACADGRRIAVGNWVGIADLLIRNHDVDEWVIRDVVCVVERYSWWGGQEESTLIYSKSLIEMVLTYLFDHL
jgi:hypothetical protein